MIQIRHAARQHLIAWSTDLLEILGPFHISFQRIADMPPYKIYIKKAPAMRVASLWAKGLPFNVTVPKAYEKLAAWMAEKKISPLSGSPMGLALYYDDPGPSHPRR